MLIAHLLLNCLQQRHQQAAGIRLPREESILERVVDRIVKPHAQGFSHGIFGL